MKNFRRLLLGQPIDPLNASARSSILLIAFFAWIGLGSDGLSSANYGPEMAFRALGVGHYYLAIYIALMMAVTIFIIALSYNQVIELFPDGGGGYKVSNKLLHPYAGVISGIALIIDYILTIAISVSAASDALFSLLPYSCHPANLYFKLLLLIVLTFLNLRGMRESIKFLTPIFLGFVFTHVILITYGIIIHKNGYHAVYTHALSESKEMITHYGVFFFLSLLFKAYSMGAGTYTGLEAVSNNVNVLTEPRVRTGKYTMFYMALSLSIVAGGITLCYLLWHVDAVAGQTYNTILFHRIVGNSVLGYVILIITILFEAGILLLGANTGFLGGPAVLSNMAVDRWVPRLFSSISDRLVRQNSLLFFGIGSIFIVALLDGHVQALLVLYNTSVFLTFTVTLFALVRYWYQERTKLRSWFHKCLIAFLGFGICLFILCVTVLEKLEEGSWLTLLIILFIAYLCLRVKRYYARIDRFMNKYTKSLSKIMIKQPLNYMPKKTKFMDDSLIGIVFLDENMALGIHTVLNVVKIFPDKLKNLVLLKVGRIDNSNLNQEESIQLLKREIYKEELLFTAWAAEHGFNIKFYSEISVDPLKSYKDFFKKIIKKGQGKYLFVAGRIVARKQGLIANILDSSLVTNLQNELNSLGQSLIILPMKVFS